MARAGRRDLRDYQRATLARLVLGRMAAVRVLDAASYLALVERDPCEAEALGRSLLVHVTGFRREPAAFDALERHVLPALLRASPAPERLRAWVVGTATGEEAYTLAATLARVCRRGVDWDVLATDREPRLLEVARAGVYPPEARLAVPTSVRADLFEGDVAEARVALALRRRVRFARHDVLGHELAPEAAVLADFHLVLCRNVLLYLEPRAQALVLERLAAVLRPGGALVLGRAESPPGGAGAALEPFPGLGPDLRIYMKKPGRTP